MRNVLNILGGICIFSVVVFFILVIFLLAGNDPMDIQKTTEAPGWLVYTLSLTILVTAPAFLIGVCKYPKGYLVGSVFWFLCFVAIVTGFLTLIPFVGAITVVSPYPLSSGHRPMWFGEHSHTLLFLLNSAFWAVITGVVGFSAWGLSRFKRRHS
jgi:hypothetical protein